MPARLTTKPEQEVITAIQALDLDSVKLRLMDNELGEGWSREYADSIETAYRNYLTMLVKYPDNAGQILLHEDVDEFWHTHILQTMKYADDCQQVFGNFLHHNPHIGERSPAYMQEQAELMEKTLNLYQLEFGGRPAADVAWSGAGNTHGSAYCEATVRANGAAYCEATTQATRAAYREGSIRAKKPAYCEATIRNNMAAYCEAAAPGNKAAYCEATVRTSRTAYCEATIQNKNSAYCEAAVRTVKTSYCEASARSDKVAYCEGSIKPRKAA